MVSRTIFQKQGKEVQPCGGIPFKKPVNTHALLESKQLDRIGALNLATKEVIVPGRIIGILDRGGRVGFNRPAEYTPIRIVSVNDTRSDISYKGEETVLSGVVY